MSATCNLQSIDCRVVPPVGLAEVFTSDGALFLRFRLCEVESASNWDCSVYVSPAVTWRPERDTFDGDCLRGGAA
jgi:hypothetical protein